MLCYLTTNRASIIHVDTVFHESEIKDIIKVLIKPHNRLSFPKAKEKRKQDTKIVVGILYRSQMLHMLSLLNELTFQKELHNFVTNNEFWTKK